MKSLVLSIVILLCSLVSAGQSTSASIDSLMEYMHDRYDFQGVALISGGRTVIYRKAFGLANREWDIPNTIETKFRLGSVSKQFIGFVTIKLIEQGKLSIDDPASKYIPSLSTSDKKAITIRNLLTHTSGLIDYTDIPEFDSMKAYSQENIVGMIAAHNLNFEPSSKFAYSNSNYYLLTVISEKTTGKSYGDILAEAVLRPLGMNDTGVEHNASVYPRHANAYIRTDKGYRNAEYIEMENASGAGGMYGTADDLLKWSLFIRSQLNENQRYREALTPFSFSDGSKGMYSSGWCLLPNGIMHTGHINGFANEILIDTTNGFTVILLTNTDFKQLNATAILADRIAAGDLRALKVLKAPPPAKDLQEFAGEYTRQGASITIKIENGEIATYFRGNRATARLFLDDEVFSEQFEGTARFQRGKNGKIDELLSFDDYTWNSWKKVR